MMDYRFYVASDYPLAPFMLENLPTGMARVIEVLNQERNYCIRGGAAYLLLTGRTEMIKDLDILAPLKDRDYLIEIVSEFVHEIFLNKNNGNADVLTLFWSAECGYYKIDILFSDSLPEIENRTMVIDGKKICVPVVAGAWLWGNKLQKVGRIGLDEMPSPKIYRHAQVVIDLGKWLLKLDDICFPVSVSQPHLIEWGNRAKKRLGVRAEEFDYRCFNETVDRVISKSVCVAR